MVKTDDVTSNSKSKIAQCLILDPHISYKTEALDLDIKDTVSLSKSRMSNIENLIIYNVSAFIII